MTISTILAATDFSPASEHAVARVAALARAAKARIELLHVVPSGWLAELRAWLAGTGAEPDASVEQIARRLEAIADRLTGEGVPRPVCNIAVGTPADEIAARSRSLPAGLVVVGAHGRHFVREAFLGSTALGALASVDAPVLVVRRPPERPYRRVVVGVDLSPVSLPAVRAAAAVAPEASLELVHAYEDPYAADLFLGQAAPPVVEHYRALARRRAETELDRLVRSLGGIADRCSTTLFYGPASLRLLEAADAPGVDLIVAGARRRGPLERLALGSVSTHVVIESSCDVLLVREAADAGLTEA